MTREVSFKSDGLTLAGNLVAPENINESGRYLAVLTVWFSQRGVARTGNITTLLPATRASNFGSEMRTNKMSSRWLASDFRRRVRTSLHGHAEPCCAHRTRLGQASAEARISGTDDYLVAGLLRVSVLLRRDSCNGRPRRDLLKSTT